MKFINMLDGTPGPRRGDLLQTNYLSNKSRTWIVIQSRRGRANLTRYRVWAERWWHVDPETRNRLAASANRRPGGQRVIYVTSLARKKKRPSLEEHMRREVLR